MPSQLALAPLLLRLPHGSSPPPCHLQTAGSAPAMMPLPRHLPGELVTSQLTASVRGWAAAGRGCGSVNRWVAGRRPLAGCCVGSRFAGTNHSISFLPHLLHTAVAPSRRASERSCLAGSRAKLVPAGGCSPPMPRTLETALHKVASCAPDSL